jgi:hypothetical protein
MTVSEQLFGDPESMGPCLKARSASEWRLLKAFPLRVYDMMKPRRAFRLGFLCGWLMLLVQRVRSAQRPGVGFLLASTRQPG